MNIFDNNSFVCCMCSSSNDNFLANQSFFIHAPPLVTAHIFKKPFWSRPFTAAQLCIIVPLFMIEVLGAPVSTRCWKKGNPAVDAPSPPMLYFNGTGGTI